MSQPLRKAKKLIHKEIGSTTAAKKFHFSKSFAITFFIVGILVGATAWTTYKTLAVVGGGSTTADQLRPSQPPPYGNPAPPLQAKGAAADVQATNGFLKVGFDPADTAEPTAVSGKTDKVRLQVNGIGKAKDFCTDESSPKCLSQANSGSGSGIASGFYRKTLYINTITGGSTPIWFGSEAGIVKKAYTGGVITNGSDSLVVGVPGSSSEPELFNVTTMSLLCDSSGDIAISCALNGGQCKHASYCKDEASISSNGCSGFITYFPNQRPSSAPVLNLSGIQAYDNTNLMLICAKH